MSFSYLPIPSTTLLFPHLSLDCCGGGETKKMPLLLPLLFLPTSLHTYTGTHAQIHELQDGSLTPVQDTQNHLDQSLA